MGDIRLRATIKDIASYCNVSEGTVDRALNNRYGIDYKTKVRVLEAVHELNYKPNHAGRALATGSTMTIGIVCFDLYNNFFPELIDTIEAKAKEKGYFIHLILTHLDRQKERQGLEYLSIRRVDGIILFPIGIGDDYIDYLKSLHIPIVTIYNKLSGEFSHVGVDDRAAFSDAVDFLVGHGYERVVFLTPQIDVQESLGNNVHTLKMRLMGYCDGIVRTGLEPVIAQGRATAENMSLFYAREQRDKRTALLCSSDFYALWTISALLNKGVRIPDELGLMGFDNVDVLKFVRPRLTTIQYSVNEMGVRLFDSLYAQMHGDTQSQEHMLPYSIVEGETV